MIEPTVGRIVWLYEASGANHDLQQPFAASVVFVWSPRIINVGYFDHDGNVHSLRSVTLLQDEDAKPDGQAFACWMPYQKGQAAKTEAAQAETNAT